MRRIAFCFFCFLALANAQWGNDTRKRRNEESQEPTWHWIELPLDHFNVLDNRTYHARYLTNDQFYEEGGPIIVYVGGEWEIADYGVMGGVAFQLAKAYNGYLLYPEHRYFGQSLPFPKPVSIENLRYINPDFSMADLVYSVSHIKATVYGAEDSQVVLVGGSYAGSLATWARLKYPHIMSMAYACGGVVKTEARNADYYHVLYQTYKKISSKCLNILLSGHTEAKELMKSPKGKQKVEKLFPYMVCDIPGQRYDLPTRILNFFNPQVWPVYKVRQICHYLETNTTGSPLERISQVADVTEPNSDDYTCREPDREWYALVCTYVGNIQTSNKSNYGNIYDYEQQLKKICTDLFGPEITKKFVENRTNRATKLNGSNKPDVTKVLSVQGTYDQWAPFSILYELNDETPVVYISEATHCLELGEEQPDETPQVAQSKLEIMDQLSKWLK